MKLRKTTTDDWPHILAWMKNEGWRLPEWEEAFLQKNTIVSTWTLDREGNPVGCACALSYGDSGWVGNLIVAPEQRGQGFGKMLFEGALHQLAAKKKVWLTASKMGAPLYAQYGFLAVENIARWSWTKLEGAIREATNSGQEQLLTSDKACWDEDRTTLLFPLLLEGTVLHSGSTTALLQPGKKLRILGPWYTDNLCPRECREVLSQAFDALKPGQTLAMDVLASSPVTPMLQAVGFQCSGTNALMVRGSSLTRLPRHLTLASLGSLG